MTDNERLTTYCQACGAPAKVERDFFGNEQIVCDGFEKCPEQGRLPEAVQAEMGMEQ